MLTVNEEPQDGAPQRGLADQPAPLQRRIARAPSHAMLRAAHTTQLVPNNAQVHYQVARGLKDLVRAACQHRPD